MNRNASLDWLKLVLSLLVIAIHCHIFKEQGHLAHFLTVDGICRIAVPIFLVINGYYFEAAIQSKSWRPWVKRAAFLYLTWMIIYSPFWGLYASTDRPIFNITIALLTGYQHLWYLSAVVISALSLACLQRFRYAHVAPFAILLFMLGVAIQYFGNYHFFNQAWINDLCNQVWIHRSGFLFAFPFFFAGAFIQKRNFDQITPLKSSIAFSILGLFLVIAESYLNEISPNCKGGFDNYLSLPFAAIPIFILISKIKITGSSRQISLFASAIYLIHPFLKDIIQIKTHIDGTALTLWVTLTSAIASLLILKINKQIKTWIKPAVIL